MKSQEIGKISTQDKIEIVQRLMSSPFPHLELAVIQVELNMSISSN